MTDIVRLFKTLLVITLLGLSSPARQNFAKRNVNPASEADFQRFADDWKAAYNGNDAAKIGAFYDENANYVSAHVPSLVAQGREQIQANFQKGMSAGGHIDRVHVLSSHASCDLASLLCRYEATNSGQKVTGRNVLVVKKVLGKWLILTHVTVVRDSPS